MNNCWGHNTPPQHDAASAMLGNILGHLTLYQQRVQGTYCRGQQNILNTNRNSSYCLTKRKTYRSVWTDTSCGRDAKQSTRENCSEHNKLTQTRAFVRLLVRVIGARITGTGVSAHVASVGGSARISLINSLARMRKHFVTCARTAALGGREHDLFFF